MGVGGAEEEEAGRDGRGGCRAGTAREVDVRAWVGSPAHEPTQHYPIY